MKTILDYIRLVEDSSAVTNVVSTGAMATKEVPIAMAKRKKPLNEGELCPLCGTDHGPEVTPATDIPKSGETPLVTVYADGCYLPDTNDIHIKRKSDLE